MQLGQILVQTGKGSPSVGQETVGSSSHPAVGGRQGKTLIEMTRETLVQALCGLFCFSGLFVRSGPQRVGVNRQKFDKQIALIAHNMCNPSLIISTL